MLYKLVIGQCFICGKKGTVTENEKSAMWTIDMSCLGFDDNSYFCGEHKDKYGDEWVMERFAEYMVDCKGKRWQFVKKSEGGDSC